MRKFVSLALVFVAAIAVSAVAHTNPAASQPNFGPNVYIFNPIAVGEAAAMGRRGSARISSGQHASS